MTPPFTAVRFAGQYPQQDVADNEVFMSFLNDEDAIFFREWWNEEGAAAFQKWLSAREVEEQEQ